MDILGLFSRSPEKKIERLRKKVKEPHGDAAARMGAAQTLYEMDEPAALQALLDRFTINVSPSNEDEQEKEQVFRWLVSLGPKITDPILAFLRNERSVYWPVRALKEVLSPQEMAGRMNEMLCFHWDNPPGSPDPKVQLLRAIEDVHSGELETTVALFLEDDDDDVVLNAVRYLILHASGRDEESSDPVRTAILKSYLSAQDRPRVRRGILDALSETEWTVRGFRPAVEESLPEGYTLTREGRLKQFNPL